MFLINLFIDFIKYSPKNLPTTNKNISNISIRLPKEDAYIRLQTSSISLDFEVVKSDETRYADNDQRTLVTLGLLLYLVKLS